MAKDPNPLALAGTLPDEDANGLLAIVDELVSGSYEERGRLRYAVVAFNVHSVKDVTTTRNKVAVVQFQRIEVALTDDDRRAIEALILKRYQQRTGHLPQATLTSADDERPTLFEDDPTSMPDADAWTATDRT